MQNGTGPIAGPTANGSPFPGGVPNGISAPTNTGHPGQRPLPASQQRPTNGVGPYSSPTMAHSPQNPGGSGQQTPGGMGSGQTPLTQMNRGAMPPPNVNAQGTGGQGPFGQIGRSPSQPGSPGQAVMPPGPSPLLAARQPQGMHAQINETNINAEISRIPPNILMSLKQEIGLGDKDLPSLTLDDKVRDLLYNSMKSSINV